jgi:hypothetical protein
MGVTVLSSLQLILSPRCRRETHTWARPMNPPTSASAVQSDIHLLAHVSHARNGTRSGAVMSSSQFLEAYRSVHALAGLNMSSTAHLLYLPRSEFALVVNLFFFKIVIGLQVPKPCPCGNICSSLGYSRCHGLFQVFFISTKITTHSRTTIGTPINRVPLMVNTVSLIFSFRSLLRSHSRLI